MDLLEVINRTTGETGGYGIRRCPFPSHDDKKPSFQIKERGPKGQPSYKCWSGAGKCDASGHSPITFLMQFHNCSKADAVAKLRELEGKPVSKPKPKPKPQFDPPFEGEPFPDVPPLEMVLEPALPPEEDKYSSYAQRLALIEEAASIYERQMREGTRAWDYLMERGFEESTIRAYRLGFAPIEAAVRFAGRFDGETALNRLVDVGLVQVKGKGFSSYFNDWILFPFEDGKGVTGFDGRSINGKGHRASRKIDGLPNKGEVLFGLRRAKDVLGEGRLAVVEGPVDAAKVGQAGYAAVSTLGTGSITPSLIKLIMNTSKRIDFAYDGDDAGQGAARTSLRLLTPLLTDDHRVSFLSLPKGCDPDDVLKAGGDWAEIQDEGLSLTETIIGSYKHLPRGERIAASRNISRLVGRMSQAPRMREALLHTLGQDAAMKVEFVFTHHREDK